MNNLSGKTALVVGASRGLGRGVAIAASQAGASVIAVSRSATTFPEPASGAGVLTDPALLALVRRYRRRQTQQANLSSCSPKPARSLAGIQNTAAPGLAAAPP